MLYRQWRRLQSVIRRRLIIPLFRSPHPPEYTARGVLIGLFVALTPTINTINATTRHQDNLFLFFIVLPFFS